ncbi:MAG TPA: alpha/beta fold hydrolase [Pyrinomonadaceae bacterium]|nr:alpha/beta fold hydrolase [Pyrinomonadaceae bacterium]
MASGYVELNGRKLYYETTGDGYPLVLLHAAGMNRKMWDDQVEVFSKHYQVIRYDARGAGESDVPQHPFSLSEDLYKLLRFLAIGKAHILGMSLGGITAIDFCLEHQQMVDALILASPGISGYVYSEPYQQKMNRMFSAARQGGVSAFVKACLEDVALAPAKEQVAARQKMAEMLTENYKALFVDPGLARWPEPRAIERVQEIGVPTLILTGERDDADFQEMGRLLRENIEGSQYVVLGGTGHMLNMEQPEEFNRTVLGFLSEIAST